MKTLSQTITFLVLLSAWFTSITSCQPKSDARSDHKLSLEEQKRQPSKAVSQLKTPRDVGLTLFASEPEIFNPTNLDVDARGRVWVIEALNYRNLHNPANPERAEGDRILILEDTDGDGKSDSTKVFYQGRDIDAALGISVVGSKVIVSASPKVLVFTDQNGDDIPDRKEVLFSGIEGVQHDHGIHAFVFGPDGKYYFNFGNEGKKLLDGQGKVIRDQFGRRIQTSGQPYREGMVLRMNQDGKQVEVLAHNFRNNFEVCVDSYGTLWQSDNDDDGNQAVRINYVMEGGNFGYKDELSGAGWRAYRTGMHHDIPQRHWHLNDPGVVPNLLQTGAGSPTGIMMYEGELLPERFRNQMIHCDAGPGVVRAYPVSEQGAGYHAEIEHLIQRQDDNWFRPSDVCAAPDGSLFVADWYDPGVGGHRMGDTARGRIFRLAPKGHSYQIPAYDLSTAKGAAEALTSPNLSRRAEAWLALHAMGPKAEPALRKLWLGEQTRMQARALWLLCNIPGREAIYLQQGIEHAQADLRITALRAARQSKLPLLPFLQQLAEDPSPQVRREVALAIPYVEPKAGAEVWATLATQYDRQDHWYLEALGIGSSMDSDACFKAWHKKTKKAWDTPSGRNLVWRTRAKDAIPLLGKLIEASPSAPSAYRYFRAMDFHDHPSKNRVLKKLVGEDHPGGFEITQLASDAHGCFRGSIQSQNPKSIGPGIGFPERQGTVSGLCLPSEAYRRKQPVGSID